MLSASPDHSPEEKTPVAERFASNGDVPLETDPDMRSSLALFEGEPHDDDEVSSKHGDGSKNGSLDLADDASIREFYSQLVTLLTQDNAPPARPPQSRGSLKFAIKRRVWPSLLVAALAFAALFYVLKPRQVIWTAGTDLLLPPRASSGVVDPLAPPEVSYDTAAQVAIIGSDAIVADAMSHVPAKDRLAGWGDANATSASVEALPASADGNGSLVTITTASLDGRASLILVSEVVEAYQRYTLQRSTQNRDDNLKRTRARVATLGNQLEVARRELAEFKIKSGVSNPDVASNNSDTNILELQNALGAARRDQVSVAATDSTLAQLEERLRTTQTELQTVLRDFFPDSDKARAAQAEVNQAQTAVNARRSELTAQSQAKIAQLEAALRAAQQKAQSLPTIQRDQDRLGDRVTILESAYRTATDRLNLLNQAVDAVPPVARSLHEPYAGSNKTIQTLRALLVALLAGLGLGLVTALLLDRLDGTVRATSDPEALWNAPVLGALPASDEASAFFRATPSNQKGNPRAKTQNIEACYLTQSNLIALAQSSGVRSVVFSSAVRQEGKGTAAANIAVAMAYGGRETLLIDADFREPNQHKNFGLPLSPGYSQVLRDQMPLSEAIRPTMVNNLYVLTPGQDANAGTGLLTNRLAGSAHTKNLNLLKKYFDFIVIDGPPSISLADAQLVAHLADAVVLISAEDTPRSEVQRARSMLRLAGGFLLGVVLNRVRPGEVSEWNSQLTPEMAGKRD